MSFIKLTNQIGDPMFVRPDLIAAYGPSREMPEYEPRHRSWIYLHGDSRDLHVREATGEITLLLSRLGYRVAAEHGGYEP